MWAGGDYEAVGARIAGIAERLVDIVDGRRPLRGATVADLACGTGSASIAAAVRDARVIGVDITPELIEIGATKAEAAAVVVSWIVADAADTGLDTGSVDAVVSNMGIIFVEPVRQVAEVARLLKPGGVLGFSAWLRTDTNPLMDPITAVLGPPSAAGYSPDQWAESGTAHARLSADFDDIEISTGRHVWAFDSLPMAMRFVIDESPMHVAAMQRAGSKRDELVAAFRAALAAHVGTDGRVTFTSPYVVITARRR